MTRAFTLIETVVLIAVSAITLLALVNLFLIFNMIYGYQRAFIATAGSAGTAMNALQAAVFPAENVLSSHGFSGTMYSSASTTLVLELPAFDSAGEILPAKDYVVFYASSTEFYRLVEADATSERVSGLTKLSSTLSSVEFFYDSANFSAVTSVGVALETSMFYKDQLLQSRLEEMWYLRNQI